MRQMPLPCGSLAQGGQNGVDQRFGVRPRLQRLGRKEELQPVEIAEAEDAVDRLAGRTAGEGLADGGDRLGIDRHLRPADRVRLIRAGKMLDDQAGIEPGVVDASFREGGARFGQQGAESLIAGGAVLKERVIAAYLARSFDWWSAISASMISSSSPIMTRSSL